MFGVTLLTIFWKSGTSRAVPVQRPGQNAQGSEAPWINRVAWGRLNRPHVCLHRQAKHSKLGQCENMGFLSRCGAGNQKATVFLICFFHPRPSDRSTNEIGLHLPWHSATNTILTNGGSRSKFFPSHLKICGPFAEPGAFRHANARPQSTPLMGWGRSIRRSCHVGSCGSRSYHPSHRRMSWQWYAVIAWSLPCNAQPL
jgi:hypothetical protein